LCFFWQKISCKEQSKVFNLRPLRILAWQSLRETLQACPSWGNKDKKKAGNETLPAL